MLQWTLVLWNEYNKYLSEHQTDVYVIDSYQISHVWKDVIFGPNGCLFLQMQTQLFTREKQPMTS